jgi:tetratricopeptide (TPR) repeat protein
MRIALLAMVLVTTQVSAGQIEQARDLIDKAQVEQARLILEQATQDRSTRPEAILLLARLSNASEDWKNSVEYAEQAVNLLPESSEAHYQYAVALRIKMSNVCKVRAMFGVGRYKMLLRRAIELDPTNIDARAEEIGYLVNAPAIAGGDHQVAAQMIEELGKLDQDYARQLQAGLELAKKDPKEAVKLFRKIIPRGPGS